MYNNLTLGIETEQVVQKLNKARGYSSSRFDGFKMRVECLRRQSDGKFINRQITEEVDIFRLMIANAEKPKEWCGPEPNCNSPELDLMYLDSEGSKLENKN